MKKNWIEYRDLKKFAGKLRDEVLKYSKKEVWSKSQYVKGTLAFLMLFHLKHPVRRDLYRVRVDKNEGNYLDRENKSIVLTQYKLLIGIAVLESARLNAIEILTPEYFNHLFDAGNTLSLRQMTTN